MPNRIALIAIDWGTTNRRGWAFTADGRVVDERSDSDGLLAIPKGGFVSSFIDFTSRWRGKDERVPVLMCGMVGSKLGWIEAPYLYLPLDLGELASALARVPGVEAVWIVSGACDDHDTEPDVMRGEECQILGAVLARNVREAILLLPGTHSKWAIVKEGKLIRFRTYMTGEIFSTLTSTGTLAQLMQPGELDEEAFDRGLARGHGEARALLHTLFGVRTLGLFERMPRSSLASYLSGLLIGAEIADALHWVANYASGNSIIAIGSALLVNNYVRAARQFGVAPEPVESSAVLPSALFMIARQARLIGS
jgi:2-dehydro-3-deoxygalactonokinase